MQPKTVFIQSGPIHTLNITFSADIVYSLQKEFVHTGFILPDAILAGITNIQRTKTNTIKAIKIEYISSSDSFR